MTVVWRYIPPIQASGQMQMAIDHWLLEQHRQGLSPSVLRFYTWSPVAISLGYHQRTYPKAWQNSTYHQQKIELVRRPSGGRAVLHQGDLTYAIITSDLLGSRQQVYESLCEFLITGWRSLGIELHYGNHQRNYTHHASCFHTHTKADLVTSDGYKLIGSAQLRRGKAILQHGSIRLNPDPELYQRVFKEQLFLPESFAPWQKDSVIKALKKAFNNRFVVNLLDQPITMAEINCMKPDSYTK